MEAYMIQRDGLHAETKSPRIPCSATTDFVSVPKGIATLASGQRPRQLLPVMSVTRF